MKKAENQHPTGDEQEQFVIRSHKGIDLGLGKADPTVNRAQKLAQQYPDHLIMVQAGNFLHAFDKSAHVLSTLKKYRLQLVGEATEPHIRVGFPCANFKKRLWSVVEEFGIPYVVALGNQADGHTVYISDHPTENTSILSAVSDNIVHQVITDLRQRGELNKAAATQILNNPDTSGFKLKSQAQDLDTQLLQDIIKMPRDLRSTYGENVRGCMARMMPGIYAYGTAPDKPAVLHTISAEVDLLKHYLAQAPRLSRLKFAFEHRVGFRRAKSALTCIDFRGYSPLQALEHASVSGMSPRKPVAFFTSVAFLRPGSEQRYKTFGESCWPSDGGVQVPGHPLNKGEIEQFRQEAAMAAQSSSPSRGIPKLDLTGRRFGRLTVVAFSSIENHMTKWRCLCDCGNEKIVHRGSLLKGATQSCGCLHKERTSESNGQHFACDTLTYARWKSMIGRCSLVRSKSYPRYGGRGIKVCERWLRSFENFLADMGECPSQDMTVERADTDGNYEPSNCHWATRKEQNRNTSRNRVLTHQGQSHCVSEWAEILGLKQTTITARLSRGKTVEEALKTAPKPTCLHGVASSSPCPQCEQEIEATYTGSTIYAEAI